MRKILNAIIVIAILAFMPGVSLAADVAVEKKVISRGNAVSVEYPVLKGLEDLKMQKALNKEIEQEVKAFISKERKSEVEKNITGKYKVRYNDMDTLSITMEFVSMPEKGAYPTMVLKGLNYDLKTGMRINYGELQSVSLDDVNTALSAHLRDNNIDIQGFKGINFVPTDFYINENGDVVSIIQEQVITPHAVGVIEFKVL